MQEFLQSWGYLGIFLGIVITGLGFPMPEELPVVIGGGLAGSSNAVWWIMLPVCIVGVVVGDFFLYFIGRLWGPRLKEYGWVKKRVLPPERLKKIEENFHTHGIKILLFARLTPGIRMPIFFTAGLTRLPLARFLLADGIYAIPGVTILFFLGYWFMEATIGIINEELANVKWIIILVVLAGVGIYILHRYLRKPAVTGDPDEMPRVVHDIEEKIEQASHIIMPRHKKEKPPESDGQLLDELSQPKVKETKEEST